MSQVALKRTDEREGNRNCFWIRRVCERATIRWSCQGLNAAGPTSLQDISPAFSLGHRRTPLEDSESSARNICTHVPFNAHWRELRKSKFATTISVNYVALDLSIGGCSRYVSFDSKWCTLVTTPSKLIKRRPKNATLMDRGEKTDNLNITQVMRSYYRFVSIFNSWQYNACYFSKATIVVTRKSSHKKNVYLWTHHERHKNEAGHVHQTAFQRVVHSSRQIRLMNMVTSWNYQPA